MSVVLKKFQSSKVVIYLLATILVVLIIHLSLGMFGTSYVSGGVEQPDTIYISVPSGGKLEQVIHMAAAVDEPRASPQRGDLVINERVIDFEGFDNKFAGAGKPIIPNIVHLLFLQQPFIHFWQLVNILSIHYNHNPDYIYFHCDNCAFDGEHFQRLREHKRLWAKIRLFQIPFHNTIFNQKYGWINHHRSDTWRLMTLMEYGGIYLDNDVFVVKPLNEFLKYEISVSWDEPHELHGVGVQVLIAHRNARLLKAHFDVYRTNYTSKDWYYNAGFVPAEILRKNPFLAHIVKLQFGTHLLTDLLFHQNSDEWKNFHTIHLMINHRFYLDKTSPIKDFNETNIWSYNFTFGEMCRGLLRKANIYLPAD